jgi:sugar phosphate isomerase/epimerase
MNLSYTVFTKPWQTKSLPELARFVSDLGFDGIELPVRPGYQVEPENITKDLPEAARILAGLPTKSPSPPVPKRECPSSACVNL